MLTQYIIVDMDEGGYPFGRCFQHELPEGKIYVRRIVPYNRQNYTQLKERFEVAKKLNHRSVIKLARVLEEEGRFHLLYEYVPYSLQSQLVRLTGDGLDKLKMKLVMLSAYLFYNRLRTTFTAAKLGMDMTGELKFYLDVDFVVTYEKLAYVQNGYITQINRIHRSLQLLLDGYSKTGSIAPYKYQIIDSAQSSTSKVPLSRRFTYKYDYHQSRYKSVTSNKTNSRTLKSPGGPSSSTLEMLNYIESRLGELKISIRKPQQNQFNSALTSYYYRSMRESVKERWKKPRVENRKYSDGIGYFSPATRKIHQVESPRSVRNPQSRSQAGLENIVYASEEENNRKESTDTNKLKKQFLLAGSASETGTPINNNKMMKNPVNTPAYRTYPPYKSKIEHSYPSKIVKYQQVVMTSLTIQKSFDTISRSSKIKEPRNKYDFEELKKNEFYSFFECKYKYIHEFLSILDDGSSEKVENRQMTEPPTHTSPTNNFSRPRANHSDNSPPPQQPQNEHLLKDRIIQAIKQSSMALYKYRKLSVHSIATEFNRKKI